MNEDGTVQLDGLYLLLLMIQGNGTAPLNSEDVRALNLVDRVSWIENKAFGDTDMFNVDLIEM